MSHAFGVMGIYVKNVIFFLSVTRVTRVTLVNTRVTLPPAWGWTDSMRTYIAKTNEMFQVSGQTQTVCSLLIASRPRKNSFRLPTLQVRFAWRVHMWCRGLRE